MEARKSEFEERENKKKRRKEEKKEDKKRKKEIEKEEGEESKRNKDTINPNYSVGNSSPAGNQPASSGGNVSQPAPDQGVKRNLEEDRDVDIDQVMNLIGEWVEEYTAAKILTIGGCIQRKGT